MQKYTGPNNITELKQVGWNHQTLERWSFDYQFKVNTQITVSMCQVISNSFRTWKKPAGHSAEIAVYSKTEDSRKTANWL